MMNHNTISIIFILFLLISGVLPVYSQCPPGDINIGSQYDIDKLVAAYPDCKEVQGDLAIGAFKNEFTPLLEYDLSFLDKIESVHGRLLIRNLDVSTYEVLLPKLEYVEFEIDLFGLRLANSCSLFPSMDTLLNDLRLDEIEGESFTIGQKVIMGNLNVSRSDDIVDLSFLENCDQISNIRISECLNLASISQLDSLSSSIESLLIRECTSLNNCDVAFICEILEIDPSIITLQNNGSDCSYINQVKSSCTETECPCPIGEINISSNEELLEYLELFSDCEKIDGDLRISHLNVADSLLTGFNGLKQITGELYLNNVNIKNLSFLKDIESIGSLYISGCGELFSLDGLESLTRLESLNIFNCKTLNSIGSIQFSDDLGLNSFLLHNCNELEFEDFNFSVTDLEEFELLRIPLINLEDFQSLEKVKEFTISNMGELQEIIFGSNFQPENITLSGNGNLLNVTGLNLNVKEVNSLTILGSDKDCSYEAFDHLESVVDILSIRFLPEFASINFPSLINVGELRISGINEPFFPSFPELREIDLLNLSFNFIENLEGFNNVESIRAINLSYNTQLKDISAITPEKGLESLTLINNSSLSECAIEVVCNRSNDFELDIARNFPGCRTSEEVDNLCEGNSNAIRENITLRTQESVDALLIEYGSVDTIYGNLSIYGTNDLNEDVITDLSPLSDLRLIDGELTIFEVPSHLLQSISQANFYTLNIRNGDIPLELPLFENVDSLQDILIVDTDSIVGDLVFPSLEYCFDVNIRNVHLNSGSIRFPVLESIYRFISVNTTFQHIYLDQLESAWFINIDRCNQFKGFKNCQNLEFLWELVIDESNALEDIFDSTSLNRMNRLVVSNNTNLTELTGLENIEVIEDLFIFDCESLQKIRMPDLGACRTNLSQEIGGLIIATNPNLTELDFPKLQLASRVKIEEIPGINSISGFPVLQTINSLEILGNTALENLDDLNTNLKVLNRISLIDNPILDICGNTVICSHLTDGKPFTSNGNSSVCEGEIEALLACGLEPDKCPKGDVDILDDMDVEQYRMYYNSCTEIDGDLNISGDNLTTDITLDSLLSINGKLYVSNLESPITIDFPMLESIAFGLDIRENNAPFEIHTSNNIDFYGWIEVQNNSNLEDLDELKIRSDDAARINLVRNPDFISLDFLSEIDYFFNLNIRDNLSLTSLEGLNPEALLSNASIQANPALTTCDVPIICNNLESGFLTGLTLFVNGESCNVEEVTNSCLGLDNVDEFIDEEIFVYPNPTFSDIKVESTEKIKSIELFDLNGRLLFKFSDNKSANLEGLLAGSYFLKVNTVSGSKTFRVVKM